MVKLKSLTGARLKIVSIGADKVTAIIIYRREQFDLICYADGCSICDIISDDEEETENLFNELIEIIDNILI